MSQKHHAGHMPWDRTGNRLLVQSSLGKNKPSNYNIPEQNFVYGKNTQIDPEKANQLMYQWKLHQNSLNKNVGKVKDIITTNKQALKNMATTAHDNYNFRKDQTAYKTFKEGSKNVKIYLPEENFTYGKPGDLQDPIKLVISNDYGETDKFLRHTMYQMQASQSQTDRRKLSCHVTKNHNLVKQAQKKRMALFDWTRQANSKDYWKMPKYNQVAPKVNPNRSKKNNSQINDDSASRKSVAGNSAKGSQQLSQL